MDHAESIRLKIAEKYLLGECSPEEREQFEEHYFDCQQCADEVRLGFEFCNSAKAALREIPRPVEAAVSQQKVIGWFAWMRQAPVPMLAGVAFGALIAYQNVIQIPKLRTALSAQVLPATVLAPAARGKLRSVSVPSDANFFQLSVELSPPPPGSFDRYECDLRSSSGENITKISVPKLDPEANLQLLVPARRFKSGSYQLTVVGIAGNQTEEFDRYSFRVVR
jgi:hypothetical protein